VLAFTFGISRAGAFQSVQRLLPVLKQAQKNLHVLPNARRTIPKNSCNSLKALIESWSMPPKDPCNVPRNPPDKKSITVAKKAFIPSRTRWSRIRASGSWSSVKPSREASTITHYSKKNSIQKRIGLHRPRPLPISAIKASRPIIYHLKISTFLTKNHARSKQNPDPQLTRKQRRENRRIGRVRVLVEHAIGGMKAFRVLTIRLRNHLKHLADDFIFAAAGLWNLKNSFVVQ